MRLQRKPTSVLFLLSFLPTIIAVSLGDFQPVTGTASACVNAYNTPIAGCNSSDFQNGAPCSSTCISAIQTLATTLTQACSGVTPSPNTLIGMFLDGQGVQAICPNYAVGSGSSGGSAVGSVGIGATTASITASETTTTLQTASTAISYLSTAQTSSNDIIESVFSTVLSATTTFTTTKAFGVPASGSSSSPGSTLLISSAASSSSPSLSISPSTSHSTTSSTLRSVSTIEPTTTVTSTQTLIGSSSEPGIIVDPTFSPTSGSPNFLTSVTFSGQGTRSQTQASQALQTHEANPSVIGGGGSPFEVSNAAGDRIKARTWLSWASIGIFSFLAWL